MTTRLIWERAQRYRGVNDKGHETFFDTSIKGGGLDSAPSPMEVVLEAAAACTAMDLTHMLEKRRKTFEALKIELDAERAPVPPQVYTRISMHVIVTSDNVTLREIGHSLELSWARYCSVSIMLIQSGCRMTWMASIIRPESSSILSLTQEDFLSVQEQPPLLESPITFKL